MKGVIEVGQRAKSFNLKDHRDREVRLSDFRGKKVLLSFHPLAWTRVCAEQMKSLETARERLAAAGMVALGISVDSAPSKKAWAATLGIEQTPLLCDFWPHGRVARLYGVFRPANGFSERANILIDEKRRVEWVKVYPLSQLPDLEEVFGQVSG